MVVWIVEYLYYLVVVDDWWEDVVEFVFVVYLFCVLCLCMLDCVLL